MGLFGSDNNDEISEEAQQLIDSANHKSVNSDRLTKLKSGRMSRYLYDKPLIDYLEDGEQPHFIFAARSKVPKAKGAGYSNPEMSGTGMVMHMVTDERWLVVVSNTEGDQFFSIPLNKIQSVDYSTSATGHEIEIFAEDGEITIPIANIYDSDEIEEVHSYLEDDVSKITEIFKSNDQNLNEILTKLTQILINEEKEILSVSFEHNSKNDVHYQIAKNSHRAGNLSDDDYSLLKEILNEMELQIQEDKGLNQIFFSIEENTVDESTRIAETVLNQVYSVDVPDLTHVEIEDMSDGELKNKYAPSGTKTFDAHISSNNLRPKSNSDELSDRFSSSESYEVSVNNSSIKIYDGEYKLDFEQIAEIQEFEDGVTASGPEGVYETKNVGVKLITGDGGELRIYEQYLGPSPAPEVSFPEEIIELLSKRVEELSAVDLPYEFSLSDNLTIDKPEIKIEGWTDGSSNISADVDASASSKGESKGIELGPFTRSKTSSNSSIEGEISGAISDNTFTDRVNSFKLYDENLIIDSEVKFDLDYSDIENIFKDNSGGMTKEGGTLVEKGDGVVIETGSVTLKITNLPKGAPIDNAVKFVHSKLNNKREENVNDDDSTTEKSADKLREVKQLYEDDIITEEEFESKKQDLLDDL